MRVAEATISVTVLIYISFSTREQEHTYRDRESDITAVLGKRPELELSSLPL